MTPELRAELDRIEDFLMGPQGDTLTDILSALRGPDDENETLKRRTTVYIRQAAFPRLAINSSCSRQWIMTLGPMFAKAAVLDGSTHFLRHVRFAARVLGLLS
jgi:hypothetical protein